MQAVLEAQNEKLDRGYRLAAEGFDIEKVTKQAAEISRLTPEQIQAAGKQPRRVQARILACYWAVRELGMTTVAVSKVLGIGATAVTKVVSRDELFAKSQQISLREYVMNPAPPQSPEPADPVQIGAADGVKIPPRHLPFC